MTTILILLLLFLLVKEKQKDSDQQGHGNYKCRRRGSSGVDTFGHDVLPEYGEQQLPLHASSRNPPFPGAEKWRNATGMAAADGASPEHVRVDQLRPGAKITAET